MKIYVAMPRNDVSATFWTKENIDLLESLGEVTWNDSDVRKMDPEKLRDALVDVDVCVCGWHVGRFDEFTLAKANKLKLIAYTAGSVASVVSDYMYERGIRIVGANEVFARTVAEGTLAQMMYSLRRFAQYDMRVCHWKPTDFYNESLFDQTVGIVGYGAISRNLIEMLKVFKCKIKLFSNHTTEEQAKEMGVQKASLEEIFSTCDIVSLHCARSAANYHLINADLLNSMREGALLVNTSRGDVIDEEALIPLLQKGYIRAALDVYEGPEPIAVTSPFRKMGDNCILLPHLGGPTEDYRYYCALLCIQDIERLQKGEPLQNEILPWRAAMMTK